MSASSRPNTGRRAGLSRDRVIAAALALVDREGIEALTMRRLAADLGVEAMSLYHWFPNKSSILEGLVEAVIQEMDQPVLAPGTDPAEALIAGAWAYRRVLLAHPNALPVLIARPLATPEGLQGIERALEILWAAGFPPAQAIGAVRAVGAYVLGDVAVQLGGLRDGWPEGPAHQSELPRFPLTSLPRTDFPRIHDLAATYVRQPWTDDDLFAQGLHALVHGLVARATERRAAG